MADATDTDVSGDAIVTALIGFVLVPLLLYLVRRRLIRHVDLNMNTASAEQGEATAGDPRADEVDARHTPQWAWREADASTRESIAPRLLREQSALRLLRRLCLADLGFGLAYVLLSMLGGPPPGDAPFFDASAFGVMAGLVLMGIAVVRYLLFRRQFRAYDLTRSRQRQRLYDRLATAGVWILNLISLTGVTVANLLYVPAMLRAIFGLRIRLFVAVAFIVGGAIAAIGTLVSDTSSNVAGSMGLLVAVLLHAAGTWMLALRMRDIPGIRLLVLRVFNIDHTSSFTFNGLMGYWRYFGNHYTVVDTSFLRQRNESNTTWTVVLCFLFWGALGATTMLANIGLEKWLGHPTSWLWTVPLVIALALAGAWLFVAIGERRLGGRFLRTDKQLVARLRPLDRHPRHLDLSFRHQRVLCHVNTWFLAVAEFARRADVVMMDLRGYSDQRKGCQKEVDFLFDAVPVARLLFLVDIGTDVERVQAMLMERWQRQHRTSPNLEVAEPIIVLYVARDNDRRDMQGILDALVAMADAPADR